jgi:hypothetical protein
MATNSGALAALAFPEQFTATAPRHSRVTPVTIEPSLAESTGSCARGPTSGFSQPDRPGPPLRCLHPSDACTPRAIDLHHYFSRPSVPLPLRESSSAIAVGDPGSYARAPSLQSLLSQGTGPQATRKARGSPSKVPDGDPESYVRGSVLRAAEANRKQALSVQMQSGESDSLTSGQVLSSCPQTVGPDSIPST